MSGRTEDRTAWILLHRGEGGEPEASHRAEGPPTWRRLLAPLPAFEFDNHVQVPQMTGVFLQQV